MKLLQGEFSCSILNLVVGCTTSHDVSVRVRFHHFLPSLPTADCGNIQFAVCSHTSAIKIHVCQRGKLPKTDGLDYSQKA